MKSSPYPKPAPTDQPIHDLIRYRWSPRAFSEELIPQAHLRVILEAARWSASCYNDQPWYFIVACREDEAAYNKMLDCLLPGNQSWASKASVLLLSVARHHFTHNGHENRHALHDAGIAIADLTLQATSLGVAIHQMAGFDMDKTIETFNIPDGHEALVISALGYPEHPETLPDPLKVMELKERERRQISEFVFKEEWGKAHFEEE